MEFWVKFVSIALVCAVIGFWWQWMYCSKQKTAIAKILPVGLSLSATLICSGACWYLNDKDQTLTFVILFLLDIILLCTLLGIGLALLIHILVNKAQKSK